MCELGRTMMLDLLHVIIVMLNSGAAFRGAIPFSGAENIL